MIYNPAKVCLNFRRICLCQGKVRQGKEKMMVSESVNNKKPAGKAGLKKERKV